MGRWGEEERVRIAWGMMKGKRYLHGHEAVVNKYFFREEVGADGGLVAGAEFFVDLVA